MLGESIQQPPGFSCTFRRTGQGKDLPSKDLYSATLHALLHFSLHAYLAPAEGYTTRGPEPVGLVAVKAIPFILPSGETLNAYLAWGLYWSIIAFNIPANTRETIANIVIHGVPVADIDYLKIPQPREATSKRSGEPLANLTSASALQLLDSVDDDFFNNTMAPSDNHGYRVEWAIVPNGDTIRRETAYDTVAYAILWTAQFLETSAVGRFRQLSVPGGHITVRFISFRIDGDAPMTLGFVATVAKMIPQFLESIGIFREAIATVRTPDGRVCGQVGIWNKRLP